jgi:uncharacterized membrane protein YcaP (DUF421 family)
MDAVLRSFAIYVFLLLIFRLAGKRSLAQVTTFDFVLLLIISEATQQAMLGNDYSMSNAFLVILTLVGLDIALSFWKQRSPTVDRLLDGNPLIIVENGRPLKERMDKVRVDEAEVLAAARGLQGLERLEQIKYAVLERNGGITIIPKETGRA